MAVVRRFGSQSTWWTHSTLTTNKQTTNRRSIVDNNKQTFHTTCLRGMIRRRLLNSIAKNRIQWNDRRTTSFRSISGADGNGDYHVDGTIPKMGKGVEVRPSFGSCFVSDVDAMLTENVFHCNYRSDNMPRYVHVLHLRRTPSNHKSYTPRAP